jgi:hypothetical protein
MPLQDFCHDKVHKKKMGRFSVVKTQELSCEKRMSHRLNNFYEKYCLWILSFISVSGMRLFTHANTSTSKPQGLQSLVAGKTSRALLGRPAVWM